MEHSLETICVASLFSSVSGPAYGPMDLTGKQALAETQDILSSAAHGLGPFHLTVLSLMISLFSRLHFLHVK